MVERSWQPTSERARRMAVINEEWAHRLYAERDLAVLEARSQPAG